MANKITTVVEFVTDKAQSQVAKFRQSVSAAEGAVGKFKAAASSAMSAVAVAAGPAAIAIGTTLVAAGIKASGAFVDLAKTAVDGAAATGLNVEQMSRWVAVADDAQVSADQLVSGIGKIAKTLDSGKWEKYGVATRDAAGNARDANDVLLDTFDMLGKTQNATERARIGNDLFGKGFANIAPLIGKSRAEYEKYLGSVEKGQVITAEEAAKAEKTRLQLDKLNDSVRELEYAGGQLLTPALGEIAENLADITTAAETAGEALGKVPGVPDAIKTWFKFANPLTGTLNAYKAGVDAIKGAWGGATPVSDRFNDSVLRGGPAAKEAAAGVASAAEEVTALETAVKDGEQAWQGYFGTVAQATQAAGASHGDFLQMKDDLEAINEEARDNSLGILADAAKAVGDAVNDAFSGVRDNLDMGDLLDDITDQFAEIADAQSKVAEDGEEGMRNYNRSVRDLQRQLLTLLDSIHGIPPDKKVAIAAEIQRGGVDELYRILGELEKGVVVPVSFSMPKIPAFSSVNGLFSPGSTPSGPIYNDPTAFAGKTSGYTDARNITIINPIGSTPTTQYVDAQTDYRRNGYR